MARFTQPGSILPTDMSKIDLDFLKKRKFIELVEIDERVAAADEIEEDDEDGADGVCSTNCPWAAIKAPMK